MTEVGERAHRTRRYWAAGALLVLVVTVGAPPPPERTPVAPTGSTCAAAPDGAAPLLTGAFVRPDVGPSQDAAPWWQAADWQALVGDMRQMCMDQLIVQWTARTWAGLAPPAGVTDPSWPSERPPECVAADAAGQYVQPLYPSSDPVWTANARQPLSGACGALADRPVDQVGLALAAAKAHGVKVWLGLQIDEPVWFDTANADPVWLVGEHFPNGVGGQARLSRQLAGDLWHRYARDYRDTIAGFYLPFEADNQYFPPGSKQMVNYGNYLRAVSTYIHDLPGGDGLGVMIAPVQHTQVGTPATDPTQQRLRASWTETLTDWLSRSEVTVVAPQSGTGMQWTSRNDLGPWARAARDAIDRLPPGGRRVELWADMEIYSIEGADNMPVGQLVLDVAATNSAGADIDRFVAFSVRNLDDTPGHPGARRNAAYRSAYQHYAVTGRIPAQRVDPPEVLPGTEPASRLAAAPTGERGSTVSLQWRVVPAEGVRPDPAAPDVPLWPPSGYQVFRDGLPIGQVRQPLTDNEVNGFPAPDTVSNGGLVGYTDTNLQPGRTYRYQVATFDPFGNLSPLTDAAEVNVPVDLDLAASTEQGMADLAEHAPYVITDATVDPSAPAPSSITDHLVRPNGTGSGGLGAHPDTPVTNTFNDGVVGTASHLDPAWSWHPNSVGAHAMTVDLGVLQQINTVRSAWLLESAMDIAPPGTVTVDYATTPQPGEADWHRLGSTTSSDTTFADPGVGWLTASAGPGNSVAARWLRLTATAAPATWTLVSEVEVYGADGTANLALPNERCARVRSCSTFVVTTSGPRSSSVAESLMVAGHLTDGTTSGPFLGWCFPESDACPTPPGSRPPGERFAITVDLGVDQPFGSLSSTWLDDASRGITLPSSVRYSYRSVNDGGWVDVGDTGPARFQPIDDGELADFTAHVPMADDRPAQARWIRAEVVVPQGEGWLFASSIHVRTPRAVTPSQGQLPLIYPTRSTVNHGYDPTRPVDADTNNPTTPSPDDMLPAVPATCSTAADAGVCRGTDGVLAGVLTGIDPATNAPYRGQPDRWWEPDSHWLRLAGADGYDIVIPTTPTSTPLTVLTARFLRSVNGAIGLPRSVDFYYTTSPNPTLDPRTATWTWTRDTVQHPNLPPYLPDRTLLTWSYHTTTPLPDQITAIRVHINPTVNQPVFTDHAAAHGWAHS
jgi:hypothetical protein